MSDDKQPGAHFVPPMWLTQQYADYVRPSPILEAWMRDRPPLTRRQKLKRRLNNYGDRIREAGRALRGNIHDDCL